MSGEKRKFHTETDLSSDAMCSRSTNDGGGICSVAYIANFLHRFKKRHHPPSSDSELDILRSPAFIRFYKKESGDAELYETNVRYRFKAVGPRTTTKWLTNHNIDDNLSSWSIEFPHFTAIPFSTDDIYHVDAPLLKCISKNMPKTAYAACVLNTDSSSGPGEHWVCIFFDKINGTVEYFDSAGNDPSVTVKRFLSQFLSSHPSWRYVKVVITPHQEKNTECGVYVLFYIRVRLEGRSYKYFMFHRIPDTHMEAFRKYLFRLE